VDHGKSTTSRMLVAYAARLDRTPIYVDLDVGQGNLSVTGAMTAVQVDKGSLSVEDSFANTMPLVYFYGQSSPKENIPLYKLLTDILAEKVRSRMENDLDAKSSGVIINTCGWVEGAEAYDIIFHIVKAFHVDVILVMNNDKLYAGLIGLSSQGVTVVKLPTSGGIVRRDQQHRRRLRKNRIKEYFYGRSYLTPLSPARLDIKLSSVRFLRAGGYMLSEGMRSIGDEVEGPSTTELVAIPPTVDLLNSCVAVLNYLDENQAGNDDASAMLPADLIQSNVAGFIVILQINLEQNMMTILSPCPGMLPSKYILVGSIKWVEK
jgi:polyribonucleotide 5'-hydroxyl-kinase